MNINRNNYETYILDYFEGQLTVDEKQELQLFLLVNPDLKEEFEQFEIININPDKDVKFDLKLALKHSPDIVPVIINENNYKEYFIASFEGDLDANQQKQVDVFIQNYPKYQNEYLGFKDLKLKPDNA